MLTNEFGVVFLASLFACAVTIIGIFAIGRYDGGGMLKC